jgi:hypothetical protein
MITIDTEKNRAVCPYNPAHEMSEIRLQWHIIYCPDKVFFKLQRKQIKKNLSNVFFTECILSGKEKWNSI